MKRQTSTWYATRRWRGYKHVRRQIKVICPSCFGTGKDGRCKQCEGSGEIEVWVNEVVSDE